MYKNRPIVTVLRQMNLDPAILSYFCTIHVNIFPFLRLGSLSSIISSRFPTENLHTFLCSTMHDMSCPSDFPWAYRASSVW